MTGAGAACIVINEEMRSRHGLGRIVKCRNCKRRVKFGHTYGTRAKHYCWNCYSGRITRYEKAHPSFLQRHFGKRKLKKIS